MQHTLFISDLHLSENRASDAVTNAVFFRFCNTIAPRAEALYILGDLFEYWVGDDCLSEATPAINQQVAHALKAVADAGTKIYFMAGNRDFLIQQQFALAAGLTILQDPTVINLYGDGVLLMHGDTLCTDDTDYQQIRRMVRSAQWQKQVLTQSLTARHALAQNARQQSSDAKANKAADIMDVNANAVLEAFRTYKVATLIHGHTHRPARHSLVVDDQNCTRWVLSDWHEQGQALRVAANRQIDVLTLD
jgi:UDP-2,3-diacylglucosamine hydrolase